MKTPSSPPKWILSQFYNFRHFFKVIQGALIAICNLYFIACFIFVDNFLSMDTYPFFLQSIIDLICNGIFTIADGITHGLLAYGILNEDYYDIRGTPWFCWVVFANSRASTCSTPFTMTLVAITRYSKYSEIVL